MVFGGLLSTLLSYPHLPSSCQGLVDLEGGFGVKLPRFGFSFLNQEERNYILCLSSPVCTVGMGNFWIITWLSERVHVKVISICAQCNHHHHPNHFPVATDPRNEVYCQVYSLEHIAVGNSKNFRSLGADGRNIFLPQRSLLGMSILDQLSLFQ